MLASYLSLVQRNQRFIQQNFIRLDFLESAVEILLVNEPGAAVVCEDLFRQEVVVLLE